jgi:Sel1 repeat
MRERLLSWVGSLVVVAVVGVIAGSAWAEPGTVVTSDSERVVADVQRNQKGCDGGDAQGCFNLGLMYANGEGVTQDKARAAQLFQQACDGGDVDGCRDLGLMYHRGDGVPQDKAKATRLFQRAARIVRERCAPNEWTRSCIYRIEDHVFEESHLVGLAQHGDTHIAYLLTDDGHLWEVRQGQRFLDGEIERVDAEALEFRGKGVSDESSLMPYQARVNLFSDSEPAALEAASPSDAQTASIHFDGDLPAFALLVADAYQLNVIVEDGASGPVHVSIRRAPREETVRRASASGALGYVFDGGHLRLCRQDQVQTLRRRSAKQWSERKISFRFRGGAMDDIARLFEDISGLGIDLPPGPHEPITMVWHEVPWDEAFDVLMASRGWTYVVKGGRIRVEASASNRQRIRSRREQ